MYNLLIGVHVITQKLMLMKTITKGQACAYKLSVQLCNTGLFEASMIDPSEFIAGHNTT